MFLSQSHTCLMPLQVEQVTSLVLVKTRTPQQVVQGSRSVMDTSGYVDGGISLWQLSKSSTADYIHVFPVFSHHQRCSSVTELLFLQRKPPLVNRIPPCPR